MKKIIATGKGGAGKTTLVATLSQIISREGARVLAIDTDPSMNLAMSFGVPFSRLRTLSSEKQSLLEELSGGKTLPGAETHAHDADRHLEQILDRFRIPVSDTLDLLVTGTIPYGGSGCLCSSISLVKLLVGRISSGTDQYQFLIVDSQAGSEILGRGFAADYDYNIVITEAVPKSIEVARHVLKLGRDLNIGKQVVAVNKVRSAHELDCVSRDLELAGIPVFPVRFDESVAEADRWGTLILDFAPRSAVECDIRALAGSIREPGKTFMCEFVAYLEENGQQKEFPGTIIRARMNGDQVILTDITGGKIIVDGVYIAVADTIMQELVLKKGTPCPGPINANPQKG